MVDLADVIGSVAAEARRKDPSMPEDVAALLATRALETELGDAPAIARRLLDDDSSLDVSWVNAVASAAAGVTPA